MPCGQRLRSNRPGPFYFRALGKANYDGAVADSNRKIIASLFLRKIKSGHSATKAVLLLDAVSFPSVLDFTDDDYQYGQHHDRSDQRCQRRKHFLQPSERRCPKRAERECAPRSLRIFAGWKWATIQLRVALAKVVNEKTRRQSTRARLPGMYGWRLYGCATPNAARSQDL
jgi:hypothetical protein